ncbi:cytochrome P450 [Streptomyces massasporeus]|uniref:cytochrome P450 n=1 Tax=Streptomyces massasporeus TaxID=67324 RepID=UPI00371A610D
MHAQRIPAGFRLEHLPYTRRVLQETSASTAPLAGDPDRHPRPRPRRASRSRGRRLVWSPCLHQHDPGVFSDPDTFAPDRWTAENAAATRGSFLAFGDGRRKCIGEERRLRRTPDHPGDRPAHLAVLPAHLPGATPPGRGHRQIGPHDQGIPSGAGRAPADGRSHVTTESGPYTQPSPSTG